MGRRKIQIAPITDDRNRNVTFGKRRNGLFKKAYELGVLCSVDVAVLVWGHNGKLFAFSSQGNLKTVVDRYHLQSQDETDVIGPGQYGGEISPSAVVQGGADTNEGKGAKGGNKKRRRSDDDSDDDDDDDGVEENDFSLGGGSALGQSLPPPNIPTSMSHDLSAYQNDSPNSLNAQRFQQQQQQQQHQHAAQSALASHPFFGNYPYPGYPYNMPNVNPALGNPLSFYAPSAAAMAAAAAATGQYNYGALPPHLLRAAAQQYAQENGSSDSTPSSGNMPAGYTPIVHSPTPMDINQQQQADNPNGYRQNQTNHQNNSASSPRSARKPSLHLNFGNNNTGHSSASSQNQNQGGPSRHSSMNENDGNHHNQHHQQQQQQQQYGSHLGGQPHNSDDEAAAAAAISAYVEQAGLGVSQPPLTGMQFPDSFLTSPSQLFPEIYRSMNSFAESQAHRAMTFGAEHTPGIEDDDGNNNGSGGNDQTGGAGGGDASGRNVFRWPTLSGLGSNNNTINNGNNSNGTSSSQQAHEGRSDTIHSKGNEGTSHLRANGTSHEIGKVKRERDNDSEGIAELAMT